MRKRSIKDAPWYPYTVAACIAVTLFVVLSHFTDVLGALGAFFGYFRPVIFGCIIAYVVNPLAKWFKRTLFKKIKSDQRKDLLANAFSFIGVLLFISFGVSVLVPQLAESVQTFANNFNGYVDSLTQALDRLSIAGHKLDVKSIIGSSESIMNYIKSFMSDNMNNIVDFSANAGKNIIHWLIAFVLSIYLLAEKAKLKAGLIRLLKAIFRPDHYEEVRVFLRKCDEIFNRYIVFNVIDSFIVGIVTAIFMSITRMEYSGMVAFVVGITNFIPTVGPIIGTLIGAFVLLMVKPSNALIFIIFMLVMQILDGYVLKPRMFGNSLGVSGLWVLVGIVAGGNMFGVAGILLAIPAVAIIDLIYDMYFLPWLERRRTGY
jgi:predicted PurR-regulated permease PerM